MNKEEETKAFNKKRRQLRRTVVRAAMEWAAGSAAEETVLRACQALRAHEASRPEGTSDD